MDTTASFFGCSKKNINQEQAARAIQQWWKTTRLQNCGADLSNYRQFFSLKKANSMSFEALTHFINSPSTIKKTTALFSNFYQAQSIFLTEKKCDDNPSWARKFLSAYVIATKSNHVFESPNEIDERIIMQSKDLIKAFEKICIFFSELYDHDISKVAANKDFLSRGRNYFIAFDNAQAEYTQSYNQWDEMQCYRLMEVLTTQYLNLESKRLVLDVDPDPRMRELYEGYGRQQDLLKEKIERIGGKQGLAMLQARLQEVQEELDAQKWSHAPNEVVLHELALDRSFEIPLQAYSLSPENDIDLAMEELSNDPVNIEPLLDMWVEMGFQMTLVTPNNKQWNKALLQEFNRNAMTQWIQSAGLMTGIFGVTSAFLEKLKSLESFEEAANTAVFQQGLQQKTQQNNPVDVLREAIDYFYLKLSIINYEKNNFYLDKARELPLQDIVKFEQQQFQKRLNKSQFNLANVLSWLDNIVAKPTHYQLNTASLCSNYVASHITPVMLIGMLQTPHDLMDMMPETFYLDRLRLSSWQQEYQHLFYLHGSLGFLKTFSAKYHVKLSSNELMEQKKRLEAFLKSDPQPNSNAIAQQVVWVLQSIVAQHGQTIGYSELEQLTAIMKSICEGNSPVAKITHKRLGEYLSCYLYKGYLPQSTRNLAEMQGLQTEISALGESIRPLLLLHSKVHNDFYKKHVEERLWKPLFSLLEQEQCTDSLPAILNIEQDAVVRAHACLHKMAFLLTGLSLMQQQVVYADMWDVNARIKYPQLKAMAHFYKLVEMVNEPTSTKNDMEKSLIAMMKEVAREQNILFEGKEEEGWVNMLSMAKNGQSKGYKAFVHELISLSKRYGPQKVTPPLNQNRLIAEFSEEVDQLGLNIQAIIKHVKLGYAAQDADPIIETIPELRSGLQMG